MGGGGGHPRPETHHQIRAFNLPQRSGQTWETNIRGTEGSFTDEGLNLVLPIASPNSILVIRAQHMNEKRKL